MCQETNTYTVFHLHLHFAYQYNLCCFTAKTEYFPSSSIFILPFPCYSSLSYVYLLSLLTNGWKTNTHRSKVISSHALSPPISCRRTNQLRVKFSVCKTPNTNVHLFFSIGYVFLSVRVILKFNVHHYDFNSKVLFFYMF